MSFSFGFAADDDDDDDQSHNNLPAASTAAVQVDQLQLPQEHSLEQLVGMESSITLFILSGLHRSDMCRSLPLSLSASATVPSR